GGASIVQVANSTASQPAAQNAAQAPMAQRPVTLAARAVGRSAEDIIAAVALPQSAAAATTAQAQTQATANAPQLRPAVASPAKGAAQ
ncbi:MAG: hypothetical protein ACXU8U_06235, partial [Asticcacaulis sp.]